MILPMMLLLTTGILIFGVAMNNYMQFTNAASIGARTLAVSAKTPRTHARRPAGDRRGSWT